MRTCKSEKFVKEREEICNKIIDILQLDTDNSFLLSDLDENQDKQNAILELKEIIPKYFAVSSLSVFSPSKKDNVKRDYLVIVKNIFRQQGYKFEGNEHISKLDNGLFKRTVKYIIQK